MPQGPLDGLKKATGISAQSENPLSFDVLDFFTGISSDPSVYNEMLTHEGGRAEAFMNVVPQTAIAGLSSLIPGAARRAFPQPQQPAQREWDGLPTLLDRTADAVEKREAALRSSNVDWPEALRLSNESGFLEDQLTGRRTVARIASDKPINRREFFRESRQAIRDRHKDRGDRLIDEAIKKDVHGHELMQQRGSWMPGEELEDMERTANELYEESVDLWDQSNEAYQRWKSPGILDRIRAAVNAADDPISTIAKAPSQSSDATRRSFFKAIEGLFRGK